MNNYKHVYFRIDTPSYYKVKYGVGFEDQNDSEAFDRAATNIFLNAGWQIKKEKYNSGCTTVTKDKQELYLHPQNFSGVVKEENIPEVEALLSKSEMFRFEKTDIYEDIFDITDEEYINILESKETEITKDILEAYKTKRSNLYIPSSTPLQNVLDKYRIKRLVHYVGVYSNDNIDWKYIENIFESLVTEGKIITAQTRYGTAYRTAKEKEIKKSA
jgi:hypothetical protein